MTQERDDGLSGLVLPGLALVVAVSGSVVLVGTVAGALLGDGRPSVGLGESLEVAVRLPQHLDDPRAAWPAADRDLLPGPWGMYGAAAVVLLGLALAVATSVSLWLRYRPGLRRARDLVGKPEGFAGKRDLTELVVDGPTPGRVILGTAHGRLLATEVEHSVLVVGATRSGKTRGYAIPALLDWHGPAVVLSAKTDLLHATHAHRSNLGDVLVFDPTAVTGLPAAGWSPLASSQDWAGAVRTANTMAKVSGTTAGLGGAGKHWERVAAQLLAPLLLAAASGGLEMAHVVTWVMTKDLHEARALVDLLGNDGEVALRSMRSYLELEPRARDSAFSTARTVLDAYEDPGVQQACARWDIRPDRLLDGGAHTLYVQAGSSDQARLAPLLLALLDEVLSEALRSASRRRAASGDPLVRADGSLQPRLLLLLDEAANIAPLPDLGTLASTVGGEGIQLVTIFQDLSQLRHRYGNEWGSIASNHVAKVVLPGITDPETLQYFSTTVGDEDVLSRSESMSADGRTSSSRSAIRRPLVDQRAIRQLARGEGLCLYGARPPIRFRLGLRNLTS